VSAYRAQRDRLSVQQATEAYWITRARDFTCAEMTEIRPPSYVPVALPRMTVTF
jgi:hypothetical protein